MKNSSGVEQHLQRDGEKIKISMLLNAIHFFLDCVFIIHSYRQYRLLVFHSENILFDQKYTSLKGAKIAFQQIYRNHTCLEGIKALWDEYVPEHWWIRKKMEILDRKNIIIS